MNKKGKTMIVTISAAALLSVIAAVLVPNNDVADVNLPEISCEPKGEK